MRIVHIFLVSLALLLAGSVVFAEDKPNIVYILLDWRFQTVV